MATPSKSVWTPRPKSARIAADRTQERARGWISSPKWKCGAIRVLEQVHAEVADQERPGSVRHLHGFSGSIRTEGPPPAMNPSRAPPRRK